MLAAIGLIVTVIIALIMVGLALLGGIFLWCLWKLPSPDIRLWK